ncbi:electron transport complex subunit E [Pseudomonas stutzeri]|jgi:electron transport complex protein RnfE|uniref:Ion-translocating oxidoreductase complex subunit E n=1 Tax=Stutzerimonas stutzeri TaxID=316 RepID=A0A4S2BDD8_STUST|nr:electron transport complex subunit E [Stutzerimonas stutzeri]EPL62039.1 RnfABCDGE type electron transport complex subunit E [Stutzerimonas stutzeri B1SMN1]MBA4691805.1 electron transport complex subunit E [Pseudomonas sp.]NMY64691.1 electron transport complex subunit E [Pseudomonas sp. WS 5018]AEA83261.1 electron transport complex, RnfABCDGE type, E subunit [Stutzerimonas stutzeri DSM 4166]AVX12441.1 electron transport complex subunit E [Stutzerimonas stutzeri]
MSSHCGSPDVGTSKPRGLFSYFSTALWDYNVALVQMLALCPALAVTTTATNGLGMGLATTLVLMITNAIISALRHSISPAVRNPLMIGIIAGVVTLIDMAMNAWMHELYKVLGLFIALIVTNCAVLGRAESFSSRNPVLPSILDGAGMGIGFTWVLIVIGGVREILGSGTLFAQASLLLGEHFHWLEITVFPDFQGILLAILPPGAFIVLGFVLAFKRVIDRRRAERRVRTHGELIVLQ